MKNPWRTWVLVGILVASWFLLGFGWIGFFPDPRPTVWLLSLAGIGMILLGGLTINLTPTAEGGPVGRSFPDWIRAALIVLGISSIVLSILGLLVPPGVSNAVTLGPALVALGLTRIVSGIVTTDTRGDVRALGITVGVLLLLIVGFIVATPVGSSPLVPLYLVALGILFTGAAMLAAGGQPSTKAWLRDLTMAAGTVAILSSFLFILFFQRSSQSDVYAVFLLFMLHIMLGVTGAEALLVGFTHTTAVEGGLAPKPS